MQKSCWGHEYQLIISGLWLLAFSPVAFGQAVFQVSSSPAIVVSTDQTALAGAISFTVQTGTTGSGTIFLDYGVPIVAEGSASSGATVDATDPENGLISIQVPAGIGVGGSVTLSGVRIDIPGASVQSVAVRISASPGSGFTFVAGSERVTVIASVKPGMTVDLNSNVVFTFRKPASPITTLKFRLLEGFSTAFTDDVGSLGQTVATQIFIRVEGLPEGSTLTFPASVTSPESGATLDILPDSELTLPTEDGDLTIAYAFSSTGSSDNLTESFQISYQLEVETPPSEEALVFLQATLAPSEESDVPRYVAQFLPVEDELPFPEFEAVFPTRLVSDQFFGVAFTNTKDFEVKVELTALEADGDLVSGSGITNPATLTVGPKGQVSVLVEEVFGSNIQSSQAKTILSRSRRAQAGTLFLVGNAANTLLDGGVGGTTLLKSFVLPKVYREGTSPFTQLHFFNPSTESEVEATLTLYDRQGQAIGSKTVTLAPSETISEDVVTFFGPSLSSFERGYIRGSASGDGVLAFETFGNQQAINLLDGQVTPRRHQRLRVPHVVAGGGFDTELNLINTDSSQLADLRLSVLDNEGSVLFGPAEVSLVPAQQGVFAVSDLFGLSAAQLVVGSLLIEQKEIFRGPFRILASLNGSVRFRTTDERLSASLPLFLAADRDALYAHIAQDLGFFTGVAILNPLGSSVQVTVEAFDRAGTQVGSSTFTLAAGGRLAKLLFELLPSTEEQLGGYFRLRSDADVVSFALFGDFAGQALSAIPSQ